MIVLVSALVSGPLQAEQGSLGSGRMAARGTCAECHAIDSDQARSPVPKAPTSGAGGDARMTETALTVALTTPHARMPMFRLSAEQRADIITCILSLKPGR